MTALHFKLQIYVEYYIENMSCHVCGGIASNPEPRPQNILARGKVVTKKKILLLL